VIRVRVADLPGASAIDPDAFVGYASPMHEVERLRPRNPARSGRPAPLGIGPGIGLSLCLFAAAPALAQDSDGDGVADAADAFPCDVARASVSWFPGQSTSALLAFEDQWPGHTDVDFNDVAVRVHQRIERDAAGAAVRLLASFDPVALGGDFSNGLALQLPVPRAGVVARRRIGAGGWSAVALEADANATLVLSPNLRELFGGAAGRINSRAAEARVAGQRLEVEVTFATPALLSSAAAPFDVFIFRSGDLGHQIHFPQYAGTAAMNSALFNTDQDASSAARRFVHVSGVPAALNLMTSTRYPLEGVGVSALFPDIVPFAASGGAQAQAFYASNVVAAQGHDVPASAVPALDVDVACAPSAGLGTADQPGASCVALLEAGVGRSGLYWVDVDGGDRANAFEAWCDMETDGGGWLLAATLRSAMGFAGGEAIWHSEGASTAVRPESGDAKSRAWHTLAVRQLAIRTHAEAPGRWASFELPAAQTMRDLVGSTNLSAVQVGSSRATITPRAQGSAAHACFAQAWRVTWRDHWSSDGYSDSGILVPSGAATGRPCGGSAAYATGIGLRTDSNNGFDGYGGSFEGYGGEGSGNAALTGGYVNLYVRERAPVVSGPLPSSLPRSCAGAPPGTVGLVTVDPSGGAATDAYSVWCDTQVAGGGWSLAMVTRDATAWAAGSDLWHSGGGAAGVTTAATSGKSIAYSELVGRELLIRTGSADSTAWAIFRMPRPSTLRDLVGRDNIQTLASGTWRSVILPIQQGPTAHACLAQDWRVSWANYPSSDNLPDSAILAPAGAAIGRPCGGLPGYATGIGVRTDTSNGWGDYGGSFEGPDGGFASFTGGYVAIYVREGTTGTALPASCAATASTRTGFHLIDPNGGSDDDAQVHWCDMTTDGGGWTLALASGELETLAAGTGYWHEGAGLDALAPVTNGKSLAYASLAASQVLFKFNREAAGNWASFDLPSSQTLLQLVGTTNIQSVASGSYRASLAPRARGAAAHACLGQTWRVTWRDHWSGDGYADSAIFAPSGAATGRPCGGNTHYGTGIGVRTDTSNGFSGYGASFEGYGLESPGNPALTSGHVAIYVR
jgi:LruC domain-containing protein